MGHKNKRLKSQHILSVMIENTSTLTDTILKKKCFKSFTFVLKCCVVLHKINYGKIHPLEVELTKWYILTKSTKCLISGGAAEGDRSSVLRHQDGRHGSRSNGDRTLRWRSAENCQELPDDRDDGYRRQVVRHIQIPPRNQGVHDPRRVITTHTL